MVSTHSLRFGTNLWLSLRKFRRFAERQVSKVGKEKTRQEQTSNENEYDERSVLVGYVRKSNAGGACKVSVNADVFSLQNLCHQRWTDLCPADISINALRKVLNGERSVTTISQLIE